MVLYYKYDSIIGFWFWFCAGLSEAIRLRRLHIVYFGTIFMASLAQSVERETLNLKVAGSTPAWGFMGSIFLV